MSIKAADNHILETQIVPDESLSNNRNVFDIRAFSSREEEFASETKAGVLLFIRICMDSNQSISRFRSNQ